MDNQNEKTVPDLPSTAEMRRDSNATKSQMEGENVEPTVTAA